MLRQTSQRASREVNLTGILMGLDVAWRFASRLWAVGLAIVRGGLSRTNSTKVASDAVGW